MVRRYEAKLKLVNHNLILSTGTKVDFMATIMADAVLTSDMRPIFECPCPDDIEYTPKGEYEITIEECIPENSELEEYELTDSEYKEILQYCKENFEEFEE